MAITREKKEKVVKEIEEKFGKASGVVFVNFHGVTVAEATKMRRAMRAEGADYQVVKKSLLSRALKESGYQGEIPELSGEVAVATSATDPVIPAREALRFGKETGGKISLLGGVLEGRYLNLSEVTILANTPSREVLLGKLVGVLNAVPSGFVRTLGEVPGSFVRTISAISNR